MRGSDKGTGALFSSVDLEARVRKERPLRVIWAVVNAALGAMEREIASLYAGTGRPSIAPERLSRAMLLQALYSIRSERQLMERIKFDLLFRWFVGLGVDDPVWDRPTFSKNRDRLLEGAVAARFLSATLGQPRVKRLLSSEPFSVDGTMVEAWASMKSVRPRDDPDDPDPLEGGRNFSSHQPRRRVNHGRTARASGFFNSLLVSQIPRKSTVGELVNERQAQSKRRCHERHCRHSAERDRLR